MNNQVRELFHKNQRSEEMGLEFEANIAEKMRAREYATGKDYRDAIKEAYRASVKKRSE
ncbi:MULTISPECIES: hypothetical protein [Sporosarcina]|uniref:hypothetical protein n=1 Tax=Sporosarcina TaxID=1569 RepID=UPI00129C0FD3|nr:MULTISPECIES: hypothetical protein [Sporosarcina]GKV64973.1 hypothetical protein NCCP2331_11260 [Sporosarcina sp. NCCP-2331]GLB56608.1 hypothetical protein NCCP2378_23950 [Sporosarcina sp. NCCP-2378]